MIEVTEDAKRFIISMLERSNRPAVKLYLEEQGCNGYKYKWEPVSIGIGDNIINLDDEHCVIIDNKDYDHFNNCMIVLESSRFDKKLNILNPNVLAR